MLLLPTLYRDFNYPINGLNLKGICFEKQTSIFLEIIKFEKLTPKLTWNNYEMNISDCLWTFWRYFFMKLILYYFEVVSFEVDYPPHYFKAKKWIGFTWFFHQTGRSRWKDREHRRKLESIRIFVGSDLLLGSFGTDSGKKIKILILISFNYWCQCLSKLT